MRFRKREFQPWRDVADDIPQHQVFRVHRQRRFTFMHIRDRLRATLAQRRASQVCWSCAFLPAQQARSLQAAATAKHAPDAPCRPSVTPRKQERLHGLGRSLANGRVSGTSHGTDWPGIVRLQRDGRTGAQVWPSFGAHRIGGERPEQKMDQTPQSRNDNPRGGLTGIPQIRRQPLETPPIRKSRVNQIKIKKIIMPSIPWIVRRMRILKRVLRKIRGTTPASIRALASSDDNLPGFIGGNRRRRYVIRDSVGKEIHIQYTTPAKQTTPPEAKEDKHYSNRLAEPDSHLMGETEELLKLWAQIPDCVPTKQVVLPRKPTDPAQRLPVPIADSLPSKPTSDTSQSTENAALLGSNLSYAHSPEGGASTFRKVGPHGSLRFGHWPASNSRLNDMSGGHSHSSPPCVKARGLHTSTVSISLP